MINRLVSGKTQIFGILGNPVTHTVSPFIHNTIAEKTGDPLIYVPFHVENAAVADAVRGAHALNVRGLNVTMPHKQAVLPYLCGLDRGAAAVGAVNTLKWTPDGFAGYNTDVIGVMKSFENVDIDMRGKSAAILGAGGSARAAAVALAELGAAEIQIVNRSAPANDLVKNIEKFADIRVTCLSFQDIALIKGAAAIIQTTPLGFGSLADQTPVADVSIFENVPFVLDVIYEPRETLFLKTARKAGCEAVNGFDMLFYQAVASYEIWMDQCFGMEFVADLKQELSAFFYND
ncbi:MAG: shikimate dehydrogenase [Clostridiales bacterium]|jgi:shikimate dehydrogenase|nr:shikimate dehydrogenase [Clostridiales bacterium]